MRNESGTKLKAKEGMTGEEGVLDSGGNEREKGGGPHEIINKAVSTTTRETSKLSRPRPP